ncbi:MAG: response regulator [Burkholderiaceae bacterium]|nr:response regulator [Burkholderiaceae bacterium]
MQDRLDLVRQLGRLSLWERDLVTGAGRWDPDIFHLFGMPVAADAPSAEVAMALVHPDDRAEALAAFRGSLGRPGRHEVRYRVPHADGRVTWVHSVWQVPVQGRRITGVLIDDTEVAALARAHDHTRTHLNLAADVAGIGLWSYNLARDEQVWNSTMKAIYGLAPEDPVPPSDEAGVSLPVLPEDRPALAAHFERMRAVDAPRAEASWRIRRPDGCVRTLMGRARRLPGDDAVVMGVAMDVTDLQTAEQALRDKAAAEHASRVKSEFLSRMSHELRTPLNAVLGFAELLLGDGVEPPRPLQRERLQHLRLAGRQLLALIDEVLEIARQGGGADGDARAAQAALQALLQRQSTEALAPAPPAPALPPGVRHELVYVEDNPVNLLLVQQVLAQRPHLRLHAAATVQEGVALVRRLKPSLVLVDLHLPDGDGLDLLALLRGGTDPVASPCVMLSADAQPQQVQRALAAGFEAYWTKPIDVAGFLSEIDARLTA